MQGHNAIVPLHLAFSLNDSFSLTDVACLLYVDETILAGGANLQALIAIAVIGNDLGCATTPLAGSANSDRTGTATVFTRSHVDSTSKALAWDFVDGSPGHRSVPP
jgi:hypothetical protein